MELGEVVLIEYRKIGVLILSLMMLPVFAAVSVTALSEENDSIGDVPDLPLILHGGLDVNGESAEAGSEIMAYYEGELIAKSTVEEEGKYNLNLNLTPENYTNIEKVELYVNGNKASFEASQIEGIKGKTPGSIIETDITCSASSIDNDTASVDYDTGSSSSSNGKGEARVVNKDTSGSETDEKAAGNSEAGFAGEDEDSIVDSEVPVSQAGDEEGENVEDVEGAEGAEGAENAGHSTLFTALVFVAALFGAFMVARR
jgi:hypothetical protein